MARQQKALAALEPLSQALSEKALVAQPNQNSQHDIARVAYQLWQARGCPEGSPDQDWFEAERTLVSHESS